MLCERNETSAGCEIKYIEVTPLAGKKAFTNRTYTTLLALVVLWYENKTQDGSFKIHLSDIAKKKKINPESGKNLRNIRDDLYCLKTTTIDFVSTFIDSKGLENSLTNISILSSLQIDSQTLCTRDRFIRGAFSQPFTTNLLNEKTNLQNLNSILEISTEIGQILFRYIDTKIYGRNVFEKVSAELFKDIFGEDLGRYRWVSRRRQVLEYHLPLIDNKLLSSEKLLRVYQSETSDKTDVKIVCSTVSERLDKRGSGEKKTITSDQIIESRTAAIFEAVVDNDDHSWQTWARMLAKSYSDNLLYRVISEFKEAANQSPTQIEHRNKFFTDCFHRLAHQTGAEWVGSCGENCTKRPENEPH